jgi:hypothetical protein
VTRSKLTGFLGNNIFLIPVRFGGGRCCVTATCLENAEMGYFGLFRLPSAEAHCPVQLRLLVPSYELPKADTQ